MAQSSELKTHHESRATGKVHNFSVASGSLQLKSTQRKLLDLTVHLLKTKIKVDSEAEGDD